MIDYRYTYKLIPIIPPTRTRNSSKAARSSPPYAPPLRIGYHWRTGLLLSEGSSLTMGYAMVLPRNSALPWRWEKTMIPSGMGPRDTPVHVFRYFSKVCQETRC